MDELRIPCFFNCGRPVDPLARSTLRRVVGWEFKAGTRASGKPGGSDIRFREPLDEYAHSNCVELARGPGIGQGSLI